MVALSGNQVISMTRLLLKLNCVGMASGALAIIHWVSLLGLGEYTKPTSSPSGLQCGARTLPVGKSVRRYLVAPSALTTHKSASRNSSAGLMDVPSGVGAAVAFTSAPGTRRV